MCVANHIITPDPNLPEVSNFLKHAKHQER